MQSENISVEILPGQEVRIFSEFMEDYQERKISTINGGPYCLIEFPSNHVSSFAERFFYDMQMEGLIPVIVHPERNSQIIEQPDKLFSLVEKGALTQVTAGSIAGKLGKKIQRFSLSLIEANLTHFIASDAHNITTRPFCMEEAFGVIEREFGIDYVFMFRENAENAILGNSVFKETPTKIKKKRVFGWF